MNKKTKENISSVLTKVSFTLVILGIIWTILSFSSGLYSDILTLVGALRGNTQSDESITSAIIKILFSSYVFFLKLIVGLIPATIVKIINTVFFQK